MKEGNTTGIRLKITKDMKKNTIQEMVFGLIFCDFDDSDGFSAEDSDACFSCLFLNFLPKLS